MATTVEKLKYTPEIEADMTARYQAGETADVIAAAYNVPIKSVIAKLAMLGVYEKKGGYLNKKGEPPRKKADIVASIHELMPGVGPIELFDSLEKANKWVLLKLEERLKQQP